MQHSWLTFPSSKVQGICANCGLLRKSMRLDNGEIRSVYIHLEAVGETVAYAGECPYAWPKGWDMPRVVSMFSKVKTKPPKDANPNFYKSREEAKREKAQQTSPSTPNRKPVPGRIRLFDLDK